MCTTTHEIKDIEPWCNSYEKLYCIVVLILRILNLGSSFQSSRSLTEDLKTVNNTNTSFLEIIMKNHRQNVSDNITLWPYYQGVSIEQHQSIV